MPWQETCYMDERTRFVGEVLAQEESMSELCRQYGISRKSGYKWLERYQAGEGLGDRKSGPRQAPWAIAKHSAERLLDFRVQHPNWGPEKLRERLAKRYPQERWPALSTIGDLLKRHNLVKRRKRRRTSTPTGVLSQGLRPNDVWCIDFKGWFATGDGKRCDPLTVSDASSRFLLCCQLIAPRTAETRSELERVFREYGLPRVIRSDNGAPFASVAVGGLSELSVSWLKLGIRPERIEPGKPQQNGCHERMHRTLKQETIRPAAATAAAQQRRFDHFRYEYNYERPHQALKLLAPAQIYQPSPRRYPAKLEEPHYPQSHRLRRVRHNGEIKWCGSFLYLSQCLVHEVVGIVELDNGNHLIRFADYELAIIDRELDRIRSIRPTELDEVELDEL